MCEKLLFFLLFFSKPMLWSEAHDTMLVREVLIFEPWKYKQGSPERGQVWKRISEALNALEEPVFKVTDRSTRDHLNLLMKKFKRVENEENRASGIEVDEDTEVKRALRDIIELFEDHEKLVQEEAKAKKEKLEIEASQAAELRQASLETYGETRKRLALGDEKSPKSVKQRKSTDTLEYLRKKSESETDIRKQELELKKKEVETMQKFYQTQQEQTNMLLQQQQTLNAGLLHVLGKFLGEPKE